MPISQSGKAHGGGHCNCTSPFSNGIHPHESLCDEESLFCEFGLQATETILYGQILFAKTNSYDSTKHMLDLPLLIRIHVTYRPLKIIKAKF